MLKILDLHNINEDTISNFLAKLHSNTIDYADLYFQYDISESWVLEDGVVKRGSYDINHGVGTRAISGEKTGFAYSDELSVPSIEKSIQFAKAIVRQGQNKSTKSFITKNYHNKHNSQNPLDSISTLEKISLLRNINNIARKDKRVKQVTATLMGSYSQVVIAGSDSTFEEDFRPMVGISVNVIVEDKAITKSASSGGGGRYDYRYFIDNHLDKFYAEEALRQAIVSLNSKPAPAGSMSVILGPGWPGVLLHEAIGHGLEGDFNRKGSSVFSNKMGEKVASKLCTIVDNGTIANRRGSLNIDDEGNPTQNTVLIEKGILKNYMQDKLNAKLMGTKSTGNGRRESYASLPIPRMTNTYMLSGKSSLDEMIKSVDNGIYAVNFGGGQVDITSGKFVFSANEAYLIKKGKIIHPIKGATIIGSGDEVLHKISMVGNDLRLDYGVGMCGKDGQSVPVGVGQPSVKVDNLTVGGTQI